MRIPAILLALPVSLAGCASTRLTPAEQWAVSQFGEKVTMNVATGKYQHYVIEGLNKGHPVDFIASLSQPRSTTTLAPSMRLCARGDLLSQHSCLWLMVDGDQ